MDHRNDLQFKKFIFVIKKDGQIKENREVEAFNRDYARRLADMIEISENCTITVKIKKDEQVFND